MVPDTLHDVTGPDYYVVEFAECLACCGFGPVCMVDDDFFERVEPANVPELLCKYK